MSYTFEEIKYACANRNEFFQENFRNFFELFDIFYAAEDIKQLYLKKATDEDPLKTYIFFDKKVVIVTKENIHYKFEEFSYEKVSKSIKMHKQSGREVELILTFNCNNTLTFNNRKDALGEDYEGYGDSLKMLYRII